ncbi:MAG: hypothetical protein ACLFQK_06130 [Fibrobacterota bacterium]
MLIFYVSPVDEEDNPVIVTTWATDFDISLTGKVTEVDGREFTLDTGTREMQVDTRMMVYNPMDKFGFQKIEKGDIVSVSGNMDFDVLEQKELMAESIVTLIEDEGIR